MRFNRRARAGQLGDGQPAGGVDEQGRALDFQRGLAHPAEFALVDFALAEPVGGNPRRFGQEAHGELFGRHFQAEEGHHAAVDRLLGPVRLQVVCVVARHAEGDVGGQSGLAHRRASGENQKVGGVQAAQLPVEVDQTGGDPRQSPVTAERLGGHVHRPGYRRLETDEAGGDHTGLGQGVELLLRRFDLIAGGAFHVDAGVDRQFSADADEVAAQRQIVDGPGVVRRIGGGGGPDRRGRRDNAGRPAPRTPDRG